MEVIDEEGYLFGVVNVVDALVVLAVLAVVIAGFALVNPFSDGGVEEEATRYATIEVAHQPGYVAERISAGDVMSPRGTQKNLTVTDVYRTPGQGDNASVTMRVRVAGALVEREEQPGTRFEYAGAEFSAGNRFTVTTGEYAVTGRVTDVSENTETLSTTETKVQFAGNVSAGTADAISAGDTYQLAGSTVATIDSVHVAPGPNQNTQRVVVGATLQTLSQTDVTFADQPVTLGRMLHFKNGAYEFNGRIATIGNATVTPSTTEVVTETTVPTTVANSITTGDTYELAGSPVATIDSVTIYPTTNPTKKRVVLGLQLETTTRNGDLRFGSSPVAVGQTIPFRTDSYQFSSSIQTTDTTSPPGIQTTRTVVVQLESISPEFAENLEQGLIERRRGTTTASVRSARVEPAIIALTSESGNIYKRQHPVNKDAYLTVELAVRETSNGLTFHGRPLQAGNSVVLDFQSITINGEVIEVRT